MQINNTIDASKLPQSLLEVCKKLRSKGYQAWLVGGAVRDLLIGREPHDFDVATDATPDRIESVFCTQYSHTIDTGKKHGTITVFYRSGADSLNERDSYEVTTFRTDGDYSDGRRPDSVRFVTTIDDDLARRDFTMNAIAYDPLDQVLRDPFSGYAAIGREEISCVGLPDERFSEDGLRCLRAIRFAAQLCFKINKATLNSIYPSIESFKNVAPERVSQELVKMFSSDSSAYIARSVAYMMETGIMDAIIPEFVESMGCSQNVYHGFDVMDHTLAVLAHVRQDAPVHVKLAALFHDIGKPRTKTVHPKRGDGQFLNHENVSADMTYEIMTRLKFSNELRDKVCHLIRHHLVMYTKEWNNATVRRWVRNVGIDNVDDLLDLYRADILGKGNAVVKQSVEPCEELRARVKALSKAQPIVTNTSQLAINGKDVMDRLGIGPGKKVGDVLKDCLEWITIYPESNNQTDLFGYIDAMR